MSMDKRWGELFGRMEAIEKELKALKALLTAPETAEKQEPVKKTGKK